MEGGIHLGTGDGVLQLVLHALESIAVLPQHWRKPEGGGCARTQKFWLQML